MEKDTRVELTEERVREIVREELRREAARIARNIPRGVSSKYAGEVRLPQMRRSL